MIRAFLQGKAGSGGPITPPLPITTNLELFLRTDIGAFADAALTIPAGNNQVVKGLKDFSGHAGRDAIVSAGLNNPPVFQAAASPNRKGLVRFFGAQGTNNQGQLIGNLPIGGLGSARGYMFYQWINEFTLNAPKPISNTQISFACEVGSGIHLVPDDWGFSAGHNLIYGDIGNPNFIGVQRWACRYNAPTDGSVQTHRLQNNGVNVDNASGLAMNLQTSYIVSGNGGGNVCFDGQIGCILVYTDQHTDAQMAQVVNWMTAVFG